jgi:3-deoxy-7-phosphoheptulonate synthase
MKFHPSSIDTAFASPLDLLRKYPLSEARRMMISQSRQMIANTINGKEEKFLIVLGPCSIHDPESAIEYAQRLQILQRRVGDQITLIMRCYFEKPRTSLGWKGYVYDPHLNDSSSIEEGLAQTRLILLRIADLGVPVVSEFLDSITPNYYQDLISWGMLGARTVESPIHRYLASSFPFPLGLKNNCDGNVQVAINGILTAKETHSFLGINEEGYVSKLTSKGNQNCHLVLRGSLHETNFDEHSVSSAINMLQEAGLNSRLLIDCSHGNSRKKYNLQALVFLDVLEQVVKDRRHIFGINIESHISAGSQNLEKMAQPITPDQSITDGCIDWETTEDLVMQAYHKIQEKCLV